MLYCMLRCSEIMKSILSHLNLLFFQKKINILVCLQDWVKNTLYNFVSVHL